VRCASPATGNSRRKDLGGDRRKQYIVNKRLQRNFTLAFLSLGVLVSVCVLAGFLYFAIGELHSRLYKPHFVPANTWEVVFPVMVKSTIVFLVALVISSVVVTRVIFKRFSQKFQAFRTAMERMGSGDFSTPVLQNGFEDLSRKLEEARVNLHRMVTVLKNIAGEIKHLSELPEYSEKTLKDIKSLGISLKNALSQFKF